MSGESLTQKTRRVCAARVSFLGLILIIILLESIGFPGWFTELVTARMSRGEFVVKAGRMRMDLVSGIFLDDVKVFRKKVVGPPAIDCDGMLVRIHPSAFMSKEREAILSVEFIGGRMRLSQARGESSGSRSEMAPLQVLMTDVEISDVAVEHLSAIVSASGSSVSVTNIICAVGGLYGEGRANGWVLLDGAEERLSARIITELDPHVIEPLLRAIGWQYSVELIERFAWGEKKPLVDTEIEIGGKDRERVFKSTSLFSMRDYTYRGVRNDTCDGVLSILCDSTGGVFTVDNISIGIDDGVIVGGFAFDDTSDTVSYRAVADVDPREFFQMVGLFTRDQMAEWRFNGTTRYVSEGIIDCKSWEGMQLRAEVEASGVGIGILVADTCRFSVLMNGPTCELKDIEGTIWSGKFDAEAEMLFSDTNAPAVKFDCKIDDCDFSEVAESVTGSVSNEMSGKFYIELKGDFMVVTNALDTMAASGRMSVDSGRIFQLPVFGGLTKIMTKLIPGLDFVIRQGNMSADLSVANGRISSEKVNVDGGVLSMKATGSAGFDGNLDYAVQLTLMSEHSVVAKLLRAVTWPISKLMEFRVKGTLEETEWYPVNFSSELLERIGLKKAPEKDKR